MVRVRAYNTITSRLSPWRALRYSTPPSSKRPQPLFELRTFSFINNRKLVAPSRTCSCTALAALLHRQKFAAPYRWHMARCIHSGLGLVFVRYVERSGRFFSTNLHTRAPRLISTRLNSLTARLPKVLTPPLLRVAKTRLSSNVQSDVRFELDSTDALVLMTRSIMGHDQFSKEGP
jgi:hypothetical protein